MVIISKQRKSFDILMFKTMLHAELRIEHARRLDVAFFLFSCCSRNSHAYTHTDMNRCMSSVYISLGIWLEKHAIFYSGAVVRPKPTMH